MRYDYEWRMEDLEAEDYKQKQDEINKFWEETLHPYKSKLKDIMEESE